jgi:predicted O-methyltransferase YrrM
LTHRIGGQLRVAGSTVIGWDMGAVLQLGAALGVSTIVMGELLPPIEAVMVRKINEETRSKL